MEEFGDLNSQILFIFANMDLELTSVLESKYLSCLERKEDIARLMRFFGQKFTEIDQKFQESHTEEGFFLVPAQRLFSYMMTRTLMAYYATERVSGAEATPPATNFGDYLVSSRIVESQEALEKTLMPALVTAARSLGFIAEVEAKKWIYKGERFMIISRIEHDAHTEKYLRMIALFQTAICASKQKSKCVDILINNFGTDEWLATYLMTLGSANGPAEEMF